jgi:mono/diheme cytochrome c family protein
LIYEPAFGNRSSEVMRRLDRGGDRRLRFGRLMTSVRSARFRWVLVTAGPALLLLAGSVLALFLLPHPVPKNATATQRLYLTLCAGCHGANGQGSWRATLLLLRPGDLARPGTSASLPDPYLFDLIKGGGATIGKPGMPAFGHHLADEQIRDLVAYVRGLSRAKSPP